MTTQPTEHGKAVVCPKCNGRGWYNRNGTLGVQCDDCHGTGKAGQSEPEQPYTDCGGGTCTMVGGMCDACADNQDTPEEQVSNIVRDLFRNGWTSKEQRQGEEAIMGIVHSTAHSAARRAVQAERASHLKTLRALMSMWEQYCPPPSGHAFMGAGEEAEEVLEDHELLKKDGWPDYEHVTELEKENQ
jgi:hypothetical protein